MRRLVTWVLVTLGVAAVIRRLRRRRGPGPEIAPVAGEGDPAEELRRKLAESRAEDSPPEPPAPATVDERRADVHGQGQAALDEMRGSDEA